MRQIRSVTVYCASSAAVGAVFLTCARETGAAIARAGWVTVYGGNRVGCMHEVAEGARAAGGKVVGITPRLFVDRGYHDTTADELIVTDSMRERKLLLEDRADAFVVLPGGLGTYEELFEQMVNRQLRYHDKPIVAVDVAGYFGPLREMLAHGHRAGFVKPAALEIIRFVKTAEEAVVALRAAAGETGAAGEIGERSAESMSHEAAGGR